VIRAAAAKPITILRITMHTPCELHPSLYEPIPRLPLSCGGASVSLGFEARNPGLSAPELADASREKPRRLGRGKSRR
jgi:hypothetical protein